ncbi:MAG: CDGSH iron-sulfur domain-containing protein [Hydrogenophilaceae bacterium]|nr:CDGSH iron-sulfur domain-containing protein [Hydrogenophilaceae bacterium]
MDDPVIAQKAPYEMELEPGIYYWCACGRSQNQPFCDGSHEGTGFEPREFVINEKQTVYLCGCKWTSDPPFCDGAHESL